MSDVTTSPESPGSPPVDQRGGMGQGPRPRALGGQALGQGCGRHALGLCLRATGVLQSTNKSLRRLWVVCLVASRGLPGSTPHATSFVPDPVLGRGWPDLPRHGRLDAQGGVGGGDGRGGIRHPFRRDHRTAGCHRNDRGAVDLRTCRWRWPSRTRRSGLDCWAGRLPVPSPSRRACWCGPRLGTTTFAAASRLPCRPLADWPRRWRRESVIPSPKEQCSRSCRYCVSTSAEPPTRPPAPCRGRLPWPNWWGGWSGPPGTPRSSATEP